MVAVAVPAICLNSAKPLPIDMGNKNPELKYINPVIMPTKTMLSLNAKLINKPMIATKKKKCAEK